MIVCCKDISSRVLECTNSGTVRHDLFKVNGVWAPLMLTSVRVCLHECGGQYSHITHVISSSIPNILDKQP